MHPDEWSTHLLWEKLIVASMKVERICHRGLSTRNSDEVRVGVDPDQMHSDNNLMTIVTRPLGDDPMAWGLDASIPRGLPATIRGLDDSMACGRSDGATARVKNLAESQLQDTARWFNGCGKSDGATIRAEVLAATRWLNGLKTINSMSYDQRPPHRLEDLMMTQWLDVTMMNCQRKLRCREEDK